MIETVHNGGGNGLTDQEQAFLEVMRAIESQDDDSEPNVDLVQVPEYVREKLEEVVKRQSDAALLLQQQEQGGEMEFKLALAQVKARLLSATQQTANRLSKKHNNHLIARKFTYNLRQLYLTSNQEYRSNLEQITTEAVKKGYFIIPYSPDMMLKRLTETHPDGSPKFYVIEAGARHPDPKSAFHNRMLFAADCHIQFPARRKNAKHVMELPREDEGDDIKDPDWVGEIKDRSSRIASIDDIQCFELMAKLRLAAIAMQTSMDQIIDRANPDRQAFEIDDVLAAIGSLQGIETPDGEVIRLSDFNLSPVANGRSDFLFAHYRHERWTDFTDAYVLKDRKVEVRFSKDPKEKPHHIIVNWWVKRSHRKAATDS